MSFVHRFQKLVLTRCWSRTLNFGKRILLFKVKRDYTWAVLLLQFFLFCFQLPDFTIRNENLRTGKHKDVGKKTVISFGRHKYGAWNCVLGLILSVDDMIINVLHSLHGWRTVLQRIKTAMPRPTRRIPTLRSYRCATFSAALVTSRGAAV